MGNTQPLRQFTQYHPIIGYTFIPNVRVRVPHERGACTVQTNSDGLRASRDYSYRKPPAVFRILLFGDSFTAGDGVNNDERFGDLLEKSLPDAEVINFGLPGSGTDQQYLLYEQKGCRYECDLLLVCPLVENIRRNMAMFRPSVERISSEVFWVPKPMYELENGGLKLYNVPVPRERFRTDQVPPGMRELFDRGGRFPRLREFVNSRLYPLKPIIQRVARYQPTPEYNAPDSPAWQLMAAIMRRFVTESACNYVVFAPLPLYQMIENPGLANYIELFNALEDRPRVHVLDVLPYFLRLSASERRRCRYKRDPHHSPLGHQVVAEAIRCELADRGIIPVIS